MTTDTLTSFLSWYFDHHPAHAAQAGSLEHYSTFGDFSAAAFEQRTREKGAWLAKLEPLPTSVDRDLAPGRGRCRSGWLGGWRSGRSSGGLGCGGMAAHLDHTIPFPLGSTSPETSVRSADTTTA